MSGGRSCPYLHKGDPWSSHSRVVASLADLPTSTKILEVGVATGILGQLLSAAGFSVYGLEPNMEWAKAASPYYAALECCTLDDAPDEFLRGHDVVICADVLEHMAHPHLALRRLVELEPGGCRFIISVPNVANLWIRVNLLVGRFTYTERGILDRTHLRFFTRGTLLEMLVSAGLVITRVDVTPVPLGLIHPFFQRTMCGRLLHKSLASITLAWPSLLGYQFVVQAVKPLLGGRDE